MAINHKMTLGGMPMRVNPEEVRWNFKMKVADAKAVGGKVIQIIGVHLSDLTVSGTYSPDRSQGDKEAWQAQLRFRERIKLMARASEEDGAKPVRFTYPPRGWDFNVYVNSFSPVNLTVEDIAPKWQFTMFPVGAQSNQIVEGIKDLYIERLMDGIGWKQTAYNGPTQQEVDDTLGGLDVQTYVEQGFNDAYQEGLQ